MAFQTNIFRDGEWVTETVNLRAVLESQRTAAKGAAKPDLLKPPRCGLLTTALIGSARVNWIFPARLRSPEYNDIALIGDYYIQVCELRKDGRLKDVTRRYDLGCRIRNACVIGSSAIPELDSGYSDVLSRSPLKIEENDMASPLGLPSQNQTTLAMELPPQMLLLVLETGDNVFLFVQPGPDGKPKTSISPMKGPKHMQGRMGFHLAVDPSSRYVAMASPTDAFAVYEIESRQQLNEKYLRNEPLNPIRTFRLRSVQGVIHKITFLYPRPGDDHHIILLIVLVRRGKSKMVIYEWEAGDDLERVFSAEKKGHLMPEEHRMPLLLIPLTTQSAFLTISADRIALCTGCLHGPPIFENIEMAARPPTANHRGRQPPLWTAWARPFRLRSYSKNRDCIYLAREDGVVLFVEADQDNALTSHVLDPFPCNISGAFACLFDRSTDVLVLGSDSGPGGYWKIPPREPAELLGTLPNWSPVIDVTTTDEVREWHQRDQRTSKQSITSPWQHIRHRKPNRIFATCENGGKGSITEYRYGLRANIGLDLEYGPGTKQAWLLHICDQSSLDGHILLLSMPDSTTALLLSKDFSSATAPAPGTIPYDLSSTTLALVTSGFSTIQITRENIVLVNQYRSASHSTKLLPGLSTGTISDGYAFETCIAISAHTDARFQIHLFNIDWDSLTLTHTQTIDVEGEITCLSLGPDYTIFAGIRKSGQTLLAWSSVKQPLEGLHALNLTEYMSNKDNGSPDFDVPALVEGIESIISVRGIVLLGTRSGELIIVRDVAGSVSVECERFGTTAVTLSCSYRAGAAEPTILACCDNNLVSVRLTQHYSHRDGIANFKEMKLRVWPVDASKPEDVPPPVHYATAVDMASDDGLTPILLISGSRLLLAEMHEAPGPVQRSIPTEGTPNRVLYCQFTQCLVAAVNKPTGPTLAFINPDTGDDIGIPTDKNKAPQTCIAGLGKEGDRIMSLAEWNYRRDGNVWNFILVATKAGRLIVVTTEKLVSQDGSRTTFRYWTRFRKELKEPIYSVLGFDEGLIYCSGQTIYWEVLDPTEKRLKPLKTFRLGSPATSLRISNGKLVALTSRESLVVLDNLETDEEGTRLCHVDPWRRNAIDSMEVAGPQLDQPMGGIHLVADRECGVAGLWVPWQTPERECEVVFEAELPSSVRKFCRGRTRPVWEQRQCRPRYGRLPATVDDAEILGVSLDGTMRQFTLLSVEAWRLLRFIQNLVLDAADLRPLGCRKSSKGPETDPGPGPEPKLSYGLEMHVDGDILRRCLEKRALEWLITKEAHITRFIELLRELDGGQHTRALKAEGDHAGYFQLAYDILEYYLSPAL